MCMEIWLLLLVLILLYLFYFLIRKQQENKCGMVPVSHWVQMGIPK